MITVLKTIEDTILVAIDIFSFFGCTILLKNKSVQTIKDSFEKIFIISKRKSNLFETHRGKEIASKIFTEFLNKNNLYL